MSMTKILKEGGRKSTATLMVMLFVTVAFGIQYPQTLTFMILDMNGVCIDPYWISQFPEMSPEWYAGTMVALLGMFGVSNAAAYYGGERPKDQTNET